MTLLQLGALLRVHFHKNQVTWLMECLFQDLELDQQAIAKAHTQKQASLQAYNMLWVRMT